MSGPHDHRRSDQVVFACILGAVHVRGVKEDPWRIQKVLHSPTARWPTRGSTVASIVQESPTRHGFHTPPSPSPSGRLMALSPQQGHHVIEVKVAIIRVKIVSQRKDCAMELPVATASGGAESVKGHNFDVVCARKRDQCNATIVRHVRVHLTMGRPLRALMIWPFFLEEAGFPKRYWA